VPRAERVLYRRRVFMSYSGARYGEKWTIFLKSQLCYSKLNVCAHAETIKKK